MTNIDKFELNRYRLLKQLLVEAKNSKNKIQRKSIIGQIVSSILRSRLLCRHFNGTPLTGVYKEIYEIVQQKMFVRLERELTSDKKILEYDENYFYVMQTEIFKQVLDDKYLKKLGLSAQKYRPESELRTYALTELIRAIKLSGKLCRPHLNKFSPAMYQILYEEALAETLAYICLKIDEYDPERGDRKFMNWVNFNLDKFLLKCYEQQHKYSQRNLSLMRDLEQLSEPENPPDLTEILYQYILYDPELIFQNTHIRNHPQASFKNIAIAKFSGKTWEEIASDLDLPLSSISSFYNRWCRRFAPLLEAELKQYL